MTRRYASAPFWLTIFFSHLSISISKSKGEERADRHPDTALGCRSRDTNCDGPPRALLALSLAPTRPGFFQPQPASERQEPPQDQLSELPHSLEVLSDSQQSSTFLSSSAGFTGSLFIPLSNPSSSPSGFPPSNPLQPKAMWRKGGDKGTQSESRGQGHPIQGDNT